MQKESNHIEATIIARSSGPNDAAGSRFRIAIDGVSVAIENVPTKPGSSFIARYVALVAALTRLEGLLQEAGQFPKDVRLVIRSEVTVVRQLKGFYRTNHVWAQTLKKQVQDQAAQYKSICYEESGPEDRRYWTGAA